MKKFLCLLCLFVIASCVFSQDKFNTTPLKKLDQTVYKNAEVLVDSAGGQYFRVLLKLTSDGLLLIPESGTPLEGFILLPTRSTHLTSQNLVDIYHIIDYFDTINRLKPDH